MNRKRTAIYTLIGLFLSIFSPNLLKGQEFQASQGWDGYYLKQSLQKRAESALKTLMPTTDFVVEIRVNLKPAVESIKKTEGQNKPYALSQDQLGDVGQEDLLLLSKLGVWAASPTTEQGDSEYQVSRTDGLERITLVEADLILDSDASQEVAAAAKDLLERVVKIKPELKTRINVTRLKFGGSQTDLQKEASTELGAPPSQKEMILEYLSRFQVPITALFLGLTGAFLFLVAVMRWSGVEKAKLAALALKEENQSKGTAASDTTPDPTIHAPVGPQRAVSPLNSADSLENAGSSLSTPPKDRSGYESFIKIFSDSPQTAAVYLKRWVNSDQKEVVYGLSGLAQLMDLDKLDEMVSLLTTEDRKKWGRLLMTNLERQQWERGNSFLKSEIIGNKIVPQLSVEDEVLSLIAGISVSESLACLNKDPDLGGFLLSVLPTIQVSRILSSLDTEQAQRVCDSALNTDEGEILKKANIIKTMITELRSGKRTVPFLDKAIDLIREVGPQKEDILFASIAQTGNKDLLMEAAKQYFPADLIGNLSTNLLRNILNKLQVSQRAQLIYSSGEAMKKKLLECVGESGKMRELIDVEIETIETDSLQKAMLKRKAPELFWNFVDSVRAEIRTNAVALDEAEGVLAGWVEMRIQSRPGASSETLKAA